MTQANAPADRLRLVRQRIECAAARAGRDAAEITIVAVSKTFPAEAIRAAYEAGLRHFGENRVQEWEAKRDALADLDAVWHLVGHLQSNKAARAARIFRAIDSLDSAELARRLDAAAREAGKRLAVLLEVRLGEEATKSGIAPEEVPPLANAVLALPALELRGLMTVPPFFENVERVRPFFRRLRALCKQLERVLGLPLPELSMGMSHDFEVAIEEGATQIRLGTALFGTRSAK